MSERVEIYISEEDVKARIKKMADHINEEYAGKEIHLIGILKGSVPFLCELAKDITVPVTMDFMSCSSTIYTKSNYHISIFIFSQS